MKKLGYKKRKHKIHSADNCDICSNVEDESKLTSSSRRAREKARLKKEMCLESNAKVAEKD